MPISREGRTPAPESLEIEKPLGRIDTLKTRGRMVWLVAKYKSTSEAYEDLSGQIIARPGFPTPEQKSKWKRLKSEMAAEATSIRESTEKLSRHPKYEESARRLLKTIDTIHPELATETNGNFDNDHSEVDELVWERSRP